VTCIPSDICPGVVLLAHMAVLFLVFYGISMLLFIMVVLIYVPTNKASLNIDFRINNERQECLVGVERINREDEGEGI
jgi:hypothetical protein